MTFAGLLREVARPLRRLFPEHCAGCGAVIHADCASSFLCAGCAAKVEFPPRNICCVCGEPLDFDYEIDTGDSYRCGSCVLSPPVYEELRYGMMYSGPVREAIHLFKFSARPHLWRGLASLADEKLAPWIFQLAGASIIPVPLAARKLFGRGYNPAYLLANHFARQTGLIMADGAIRRVRATLPQFGLNKNERAENVKGAFAVYDREAIEGKDIIIFDDIFTTGATIAECAKTIAKAKPNSIRAAALCRVRK